MKQCVKYEYSIDPTNICGKCSSYNRTMNVNYLPSARETKTLDTNALRNDFLIEELFKEGEINYDYFDLDRVIVGAASPRNSELRLQANENLKSEYFCQRRELGVFNLGGKGIVEVDGKKFEVDHRDCIYIGRGSEEVLFSDPFQQKPEFYLLSYIAHKTFPTTLCKMSEANHIEIGSPEQANQRVLHQYIHENGVKSCQLVMGFTELKSGSVWNTMPAHTHDRRSEVYLYFDIPQEHTVFHFMGKPSETRHLCVHNKQAVLSPPWSIHSGCGTTNYSFVWGMGGENQSFDDMDSVSIADLK